MLRLVLIIVFTCPSCTYLHAQAKDSSVPTKAQLLNKLAFEQRTVTDNFGRDITYYLSRWPLKPVNDNKSEKPLGKQPLIVIINGSGAQSVFARFDDKVSSGLQGLLLRIVQGRARVLVVEKPGVEFLDDIDQPGSAIGASVVFLQEHTLDRWGEAHMAAIRSVWKNAEIDSSRTLVMGHSEGSGVAAYLAAELNSVTNVACLSGGGATQLFSLTQLALRQLPGDQPGDALRRRQAIYDGWSEVQKDPQSTEKFWMGHPHRRWSSFLPHNSANDLSRSKAKIYLVQGTSDTSEAAEGHDYTVAILRANGIDVIEELIEYADHGFQTPAMVTGSPDGFTSVFTRITDWFLQ